VLLRRVALRFLYSKVLCVLQCIALLFLFRDAALFVFAMQCIFLRHHTVLSLCGAELRLFVLQHIALLFLFAV